MNEHSENEQFARLGYERVALVEQEGIAAFVSNLKYASQAELMSRLDSVTPV